MDPKSTKQLLSVLGFFFLALTIPVASYFVTKTVFDIRNQAAEGFIITVCPEVGDGCDFVGGDGIQQAVDAAQDGDEVLIKAGTYSRTDYTEFTATGSSYFGSPVNIKVFLNLGDKELTVRGEPGTVLDGANSSKMGGIAKNSSTQASIKGLTISGFTNDDGECDFNTEFCPFGCGIILMESSSTSITGNTFTDNHCGVYVDGDSIATIENNLIDGSEVEGIRIENGSSVEIRNTSISNGEGFGNRPGGISVYRSPDVTIVNNIIVDNDNKGIYVDQDDAAHTGTLTLNYNNVWHNYVGETESNYVGTDPGANDISEDPLFVSETDFHLQSSSPSVDTGDPALSDPDETRSDMGAYGGPDACIIDPELEGCSEPVCTPDCTDKECGDDGCGGSCGTCPDGETCNDSGTCEAGECTPDCTGKECGDDGCSGTCGTCPDGETCNDTGTCEAGECTPDCTGKECGDDGCGGTCGTCLAIEECSDSGTCELACTPLCTGKECGDDGCGGTCGTCEADETCSLLGQCEAECTPNCLARACGDDGCGGTCGTCGSDETCSTLGICIALISYPPPSYTIPSTPTTGGTTGTTYSSTDTTSGTTYSTGTTTGTTASSDLSALPNTGIFDDWGKLLFGSLFIAGGTYIFIATHNKRLIPRVLVRKDDD